MEANIARGTRSLPEVAARFPQWADLPTNARYLFALALRAGIAIAHDGQRWIWYGTVQQLQGSDIWPHSQDWKIQRHRRTFTTEGLRGHVIRDARNPEVLQVLLEGFRRLPDDRRAYRHSLARADRDALYLRFREQLLSLPPVEGAKHDYDS